MPIYIVTLVELAESLRGCPVLTAHEAFCHARDLAVQRGLDLGRPYVVSRPFKAQESAMHFAQAPEPEEDA